MEAEEDHGCDFQTNLCGTRARIRACHHTLRPSPDFGADDKEIANALRAGGLIIVVRHGNTFRDQADTDSLHYDNVAGCSAISASGRIQERDGKLYATPTATD